MAARDEMLEEDKGIFYLTVFMKKSTTENESP